MSYWEQKRVPHGYIDAHKYHNLDFQGQQYLQNQTNKKNEYRNDLKVMQYQENQRK